jgi:nicotinamide phosphoribosyltransferase
MNKNPLLMTDVYKLGHAAMYPEGTTEVYSYLQARTDKSLEQTVFFGLQYYLEEYLSKPITQDHVDEFLDVYAQILGEPPQDVVDRMEDLANLGYWPLEIKAVPEGEVMPVQNVLMTIRNTHPDFAWCVGYVESLLLKVWNTITVASYSLKLRKLVTKFARETCDDMTHLPFQVHDFGYRGVSSEETAELSGASHLLNFFGTDTVPAVRFLMKHYGAEFPIGLSVPATEHSVMCAYEEKHEFDAFRRLLQMYPTGIVSIVSDTYNLWRVLGEYAPLLKRMIIEREGKLVFRPDSGDPEKIICGDPQAVKGSPEWKGSLEMLAETFGTTTNSKGYRVLNPAVGLIYGDGFYFDRYQQVLARMREQGWASSNLVTGIGGLLLQAHTRDELGFAIKATRAIINGDQRELIKDPVTDHKKKSHKGLLRLVKYEDGSYATLDMQSAAQEASSFLTKRFLDGKMVGERHTLAEIRERISQQTGLPRLVLA